MNKASGGNDMTSTARPEAAVNARAFYMVAALLFLGSAATTLAWCGSMAAMPGMPWMRMPGQSWPDAAAAFLGMWTVMMIAMMLPVLIPPLLRYRRDVAAPRARAGGLTILMGVGYFSVWILAGILVFPLGVALAGLAPVAAGITVVLAGLLQFTRWKERQLDCCDAFSARGVRHTTGFAAAWFLGARLGLRCCYCCAPLTAVLFVAGVMDLRAMTAVTLATAAERLAPKGARTARAIGIMVIAAGAIYLLEKRAALFP
jgi:predicted metal-binding membrane protein